ncbi:MAG: hypothetical protein H0X62_06405, partial [Bacteroidetes bacterium]|nr:hypothetical protein [Bacteroidota bacterium]
MGKAKVIYFYPVLSSFIKKDLDILKEEYKLISKSFNPSKKAYLPFSFLSQFFFLLKQILTANIVVCRFVGYHSFLPAFFGWITGRPVLFILGGTECHYFPKFNYGGFTNKLYATFIKLSFRFGSHIAPVHESLVESDYEYDPSGEPRQGYKYFCPWVKIPYTPIYNGYDSSKFFYTGIERKANSFITIASNFDGSE